jgi:hypothetical protein
VQPAVSQPVPPTLPAEWEEQKQTIDAMATQLTRIETQIKRTRREAKRLKADVAEQAATAAAAAVSSVVGSLQPLIAPAPAAATSPSAHTQVDMELFAGTVQQNLEDVVGRAERKTQQQLAEMEARLQRLLRRSSPQQQPSQSPRHQQQSSTVAPMRAAAAAPPQVPFVSPATPAKNVKADHRKRKSRGNASPSDITQFRKALFRHLLREE